ncbi:NRAMP family divalent metal transporter [Frateuria terrea]|uniref:NRAMP (Natural resistance-associated macrophage protein) metal ion transporters n=1 Tax=Frateuria terrea TaxID=529704 RepID=A0A1H6URN2_9GAMM|nr:divalent metal cation transporter [Frateuria terrea]SEI94911.1 NRAMP (natural resistance-associated macrophage protein) metal ion transporters [Frateuria terrea]SFP33699.1 NRAMP (natural resistance-associated macrophage protein) metal ion transporters [Frateuria terrea]
MAIRLFRHGVALRVRRLRGSAIRLGAGLITGAADDDPSGIATYSQAGARFGLATLWTVWFTLPLMIGIQAVCAHIGRVTGRGLAANMTRCFPRALTLALVALLLAANVFNLAADLGAMGEATHMLLGGSASLFVVLFAALSAVLEVAIPFARYARLLKVLTLSLLAYVLTTLVVHVPWAEALHRLWVPVWRRDRDYLLTVVAMFGTTISPYMFFWQAAQEVEEEEQAQEEPLLLQPAAAPGALRRIDLDTVVGMIYSNAIGFFVVLAAAVVLHGHGVRAIEDAADAARALRPLAGRFAGMLFAMGIVGTGLLAIPVLAGSGAYALAEVFHWSSGLDRRFGEAKLFYGLIILATLGGAALSLTPTRPIHMLFWAAVLNGVISVPLMAAAMWLATRREVMGALAVRSWLRLLGWAATAAMAGVVAAMAFA